MRDDAVGSIPVQLLVELCAGDTQAHSSSEAENGFPSPTYCRLEHLYTVLYSVLLSLTLISLKGVSELIPGFEFCHWMIHEEHRPHKSSNMHSKHKSDIFGIIIRNISQHFSSNTEPLIEEPRRWTHPVYMGEIGISRSEVRGKKPKTKPKTQHSIKDPPLTKVVRTCFN